MEQIEKLVRLIVYSVALWTMVELLLPKGTFQKYIRFICGLVILSIFLRPISDLRQVELFLPALAEGQTYTDAGTDALIRKVYQGRLERQLQTSFGVEQVHVLLDDRLQIIDIITTDSVTKQRMMRYIQNELP